MYDLEREIMKLFPVLEIILPGDLLLEIRTTELEELNTLHFGLGMYLRNNFLSADSKLYGTFISAGVEHRDDMSAVIIRMFHDYTIAQ